MTLFCTVSSLKGLSMIVFDAETKVVNTEIIPQHTIADLHYGITFIVFAQSGEVFTVVGNKHTHTHTHTHTNTQQKLRTRPTDAISGLGLLVKQKGNGNQALAHYFKSWVI